MVFVYFHYFATIKVTVASCYILPSLVAHSIKDLPAMQETLGLIPRSERSPGEGKGNPLRYSCLENPMDRGVWQAIVHGVTESDVTEVT